jgi:4-hydroxybenzoate polyprenyltransferase
MSAAALVRSLRPHQWIKNVFVAAPLVFSRHLTDRPYLLREALAVLAFCLLSGAVYTFNDVRDVEADRVHPRKRLRPIASGALSERAALIAAGVIAAAALAAAFALDVRCGALSALYLAQNIAYSIKLKHVAFLDVGLVAAGFLLRVLAGAAAIDVPASGWVLLCTGLVAVFFGLGKRAHELAWAGKSGAQQTTRAALAGYRMPVVRVSMLVLGAATVLAYCAYTLDPHTAEMFGTERLVWSAPFVALGIARFLMLALWTPRDDSPTEAMLRDPWFLADLAAAAGVVLYILYS